MISDETFLKIREEFAQLTNTWLSKARWIHGVGIGLKQVAGSAIGQDAIVFLVEMKVPEDQLERESIIPKWIEFRSTELVLPTDVRVEPLAWFLTRPRCTNTRPAHGGDCIAPLGAPFVSTLGA